MSNIKAILTRMMKDPDFADAIFADAESTLDGYELTVDELSIFKGLSRTDFIASATEERKSFSLAEKGSSGGPGRGGWINNHNETLLVVHK